ncbi:MAG TPA: multicopper oxidase domain-containing protein [Candidatus Acidoferrum sp.]|nr:multicopper oxidase domain-containing protein [Candidatus Acidoferrum sp.]
MFLNARRITIRFLLLVIPALASGLVSGALADDSGTCARPAAASAVFNPSEVRSENGVLRVDLTYRNSVDSKGRMRYCYVDGEGREAPTLRVHPGDQVILTLKNDVALPSAPMEMAGHVSAASPMSSECGGGAMMRSATNLHFHGLMIPPTCHQDDVLATLIDPSSPPFEYKFKIPEDQPPGLYWYHPHVHGFTKEQVLGGASGALIVEGIENAVPQLAGLPDRVFVVRDENLANPNAMPTGSAASVPPAVLDRDGDAVNTGTGTGTPAKDLSINFVPVPYPDYPPAIIRMKPKERQLWRVLNASAITYLNLQVVFNGVAQPVGVVGLDGSPIPENGLRGQQILWLTHLGVPPGGRVEFVVNGPPLRVKAELVTRSVNTGPIGENDPARPLATIVASRDAAEPTPLPASTGSAPVQTEAWLGNVKPVRVRRLYFSEKPQDPGNPAGPADFYLTVEGQQPKLFDPSSSTPNIVVRQGDVEDWIIENRSREVHAFHIHQVRFLLLEWYGIPVNEPYLRDTINVPFWDGVTTKYPEVKVRVDFRDPNSVGTFVYHCHILEHEDGGMMGTIRVESPANTSPKKGSHP